MTSMRKAFVLGFLVWLFPLRASSRPLFESIMPVAVTVVAVSFGVLYSRNVKRDHVKEGLVLGLLWLAMSVLIDLPLMLSAPINMTLAEYVADVGVAYLIIPAVTVGLGAVRASANTPGQVRE